MVGSMLILFVLIVGLVYRFDPEARRRPSEETDR